MSQRTSRRILTGLATTAVHSSINVKRHLSVATCCLAEPSYILGVVISHENLVGVNIIAKDFCPALTAEVYALFEPGMQSLLILAEIAYQFMRKYF